MVTFLFELGNKINFVSTFTGSVVFPSPSAVSRIDSE